MPEELRRRLKASAARSGRSLNAELVHRLERSLRPSPLRAAADTAAAMTRQIKGGRGQVLRTRYRVVIGAVVIPAVLLAALLLAFSGSSRTGHSAKAAPFSKALGSDPDAPAATPGLGPNTFEAYLSAERTYPANVIPPAIANRAEAAFDALAAADAKSGDPGAKGRKWKLYGPTQNATQPGVTAFSGATNNTAARTTALVVDPSCHANGSCRVWAGVSGGGVWRTDNALAANPDWKQVGPKDLAQNSVGTLILDPSDKKNDTLYLGTGEGHRCSSGCEAGVGIYKSTDSGNHWSKLDDTCVNNATYTCVNPGKDAFLGRAINSIVIDPTNANHIFVGSAQAVRGLSHVIGNGGTTRLEPGANEPGVYESTNGGVTFTEVWNGAKPDPGPQSFGINKVALDPSDPTVVYASAFDAGLWRRDHGAAATAFSQVFKPQFTPPQCTVPVPPAPPTGCGTNGVDRTMFALTVKGGHTRIYLTEGTQPAVNSVAFPTDSNFWRTDLGDQSAATLLASQTITGGACSSPDPATHTFPATYTGWQCLTSQATGNPYFATDDFCTQQCWYDQDVYTPAGMPDTVYVIGSNLYGEQPCNTNGVGCGNGRSNGREVIYSTTAGDPDGAATGAANLRTFTDLSYDATINHPPWCAFAPYFDNGCVNAPNGIHPDQHAIAINPGNPTQIFEGSDGGLIRTSGDFADISSQCDEPHRNGGGPLTPTVGTPPVPNGSYIACKRLLSRAPTLLEHIDRNYSSTLQFINVAINPGNYREVMGGTQDNGTWSNVSKADRNTFLQVIYGDGGNAVYDGTEPTWRANEFTSGFGDSNFRNGDPERWVIATAPVVNSGEGPAFYWPQVGDPNPVPGTHPIYSGAKHVWRSWAFGAGTPHAVPQDTTPNVADYEANCPEFVVSGAQDGCGDYQPLGGPYCDGLHPAPPAPDLYPDCTNQPGDLTGTVYGTDRSGGSISWIARDSADHGTIWVATSAGRIFVTHNGDAGDPSTVTWLRVDNSVTGGSPTRFPSGITVDPSNVHHAWISYSGYNAVTPTTPGHVFSVTENGVSGAGVFTNLNIESGSSAFPTPFSDGDLPVADIVRDDATHTLYAATDFGALRGDDDGASWHVTAGMPRYEVMHLEIQPSSRVPTCTGGGPCKRVLYAATHSQGIWRMNLGPAH
jgi:plasmid stability protein